MKVIITKKGGYGAKDGRVFEFGQTVELEDGLAAKLIRNDLAKPAPKAEPKPKAAPPLETAEVAPAENTAKPATKPKARKSRPAQKG